MDDAKKTKEEINLDVLLAGEFKCCTSVVCQMKLMESPQLLAELYGPVVTDASSVYFLGATVVQTNNTGELTAVGEGILWLITNLPKICSSMPTPLTHIWVHSGN